MKSSVVETSAEHIQLLAAMGHDKWQCWRRTIWLFAKYLFMVLLLTIALALSADFFISFQTQSQVMTQIEQVPPTPVALVLGTTRWHEGRPNQYYRARIETAAALYHSGRVRGILVSGDNASIYYNEPRFMRKDLIALGVPDTVITSDYAGFRTLDSIVRAKKVFGLDEIVVISQRFHVERALFIAQHVGIRAIGLAAPNPTAPGLMKTRVREVPARIIAVFDIMIDRPPRFLGAAESVKLRSLPDESPISILPP
ncbi:YdcF family protein [Rhodoferax sp. 4810]|uniref:YdcF family protein n=1 Tax=Thiospirillum jenense TaxID=1653858 RepID=A0A839H4B9_9GAMM|nr:ElyC/SanA/YdcF family protein [Thiospirillum jenense]MBB1073047.1 YdcF family protein [Rhodoferax jenense]MBB1124995.1 YdcF family protein [Thiospirillum jenense]